MVRVGIIGGTGYTALELLKRLSGHPEVSVEVITSRDPDSPQVGKVHPELFQVCKLSFEQLEIESFCQRVDFAFSCLPHAASAEIVKQLADRDLRVVDFSADYRLNDVATFEKWYGVRHPDPERVGNVVYGLCEWFREDIKNAQVVANPGCFPTSVLMPLLPLAKEGLIDPLSIIVDSKTGVSGAGRKANLKFHYPECNESVLPYALGSHRHGPEMEQILNRVCGFEPTITFSPHLVPMNRGILSTIYVRPANGANENLIKQSLIRTYSNETFVRVVDQLPTTRQVSGTNFCDIAVVPAPSGVIIVCAIDNLVKGASGAAIQNMNLMLGFSETTAI